MSIIIKKGTPKKRVKEKLKEFSGKKFPASKFSGKIKIKEDAVAIQRKLRDEWT